jgi:hypothetical protein
MVTGQPYAPGRTTLPSTILSSSIASMPSLAPSLYTSASPGDAERTAALREFVEGGVGLDVFP